MKRIIEWFQENSDPLQTIAVSFLIIQAVLAFIVLDVLVIRAALVGGCP